MQEPHFFVGVTKGASIVIGNHTSIGSNRTIACITHVFGEHDQRAGTVNTEM